uniref:Uncharacterized protein n=1 Tax=Arundo donax TaxID=35708 RepID=A0A0A8YZI1_ARUDO
MILIIVANLSQTGKAQSPTALYNNMAGQ